jgi:putative membrane protein
MNPDAIAGPASEEAIDVLAIERPHHNLLVYYGLGSLLLGPIFFVALVPLYYRYHTLRYRFDEEGVSMRWGILFRREIHLTYSRIQDIHLTSNLVERWLGLGKVQIQTASGSSKAELMIEGRQDFDAVRDFLYSRMRGMAEPRRAGAEQRVAAGIHTAPAAGAGASVGAAADPELAALLREIAGELRATREALAPPPPGSAP